jgi:hypothetical protein
LAGASNEDGRRRTRKYLTKNDLNCIPRATPMSNIQLKPNLGLGTFRTCTIHYALVQTSSDCNELVAGSSMMAYDDPLVQSDVLRDPAYSEHTPHIRYRSLTMVMIPTEDYLVYLFRVRFLEPKAHKRQGPGERHYGHAARYPHGSFQDAELDYHVFHKLQTQDTKSLHSTSTSIPVTIRLQGKK